MYTKINANGGHFLKVARVFFQKLYQQHNHANMRNTWLDTDNSHLYSSARLVGFMEELAS